MGKEFGERVRYLRGRAHLTQFQVAVRLFTSPATISRWESGQDEPPAGRLAEIAAALQAEPYEFFLDDEENELIRSVLRFLRRRMNGSQDPENEGNDNVKLGKLRRGGWNPSPLDRRALVGVA